MQCPNCQFDNPPTMKFCGECGSKLIAVCPSCGAQAPPGFKFCGECGSLLAGAPRPAEPPAQAMAPPPPATPPAQAPQPAPQQAAPPPARAEAPVARSGEPAAAAFRAPAESQRKQVTVLACGLKATDASGAALDAERRHAVLSRLMELVHDEIERFDGVIVQRLGSGFIALFGAPIAHEDHALRATLAAAGIGRKLRATDLLTGDAAGVVTTAAMGLDTGAVVYGGSSEMAVGEATDRAAELRDRAADGVILASSTTARLVRGSVELQPLKVGSAAGEADDATEGRAEGGQVYEVVGTASGSGEQDGQRGEAAARPLVGRTRELAVLDQLSALADSGRGQVVGLTGEAGSGKSRLLLELRRRLEGTAVRFLRGECLSYGERIPYHPFSNMVRTACGMGSDDDQALVAQRLREGLGGLGCDPEASLPYLLRLLGTQEGAATINGMDARLVQAGTFAALRNLVTSAGGSSLTVVEIEDLHWIDTTSEELLGTIIERLGASRILVVLTYRSGYRPTWLNRSYATQITIQPLSLDESHSLVSSILDTAELRSERARHVLQRAEGNPLFLEELALALLEHGEEATLDEATIPSTVEDLLMARLDRLPEDHKRLLQTASVLGREFSTELLDALWDRSAAVETLLDELKRWELLYEVPGARGGRHQFKHALTQEVAYSSLLTSRRQALHAAAGRALERLHADNLPEVYDRLAHHYPRAGMPDKTVHYLHLFARKAARDYSHAEAAAALEEALVHAESLAAEDRDRRVAELILALAESQLPLARFPDTLKVLEGSGDRIESLNDQALEARYHFWLAHTNSYLGRQDEASAHGSRSAELARACGDEAIEGKACYVLGRDAFWSGRFKEGLEHSLRAIVLLERSGEPWWQGQAHWVAGFHHHALGQLDQGLAAMANARTIGEALDDPRLDTSWSTGYFQASAGRWEQGIEECRGGVERARDPLNTAAATGFLGYAYLEMRDRDRAIATLEDAVARLEGTGMQQLHGWFLAHLGEAYLLADRADEAADAARRAIEITTQARFWFGVGLAERSLGQAELAAGRLEPAAEHLTAALDRFETLAVPLEVARAHLELAALDHAAGTGEVARHLSEAHRIFSELGASRYVVRVLETAGELGVAVDELSQGPGA